MAEKKLNEVTAVTTLNSTDYVTVILANGEIGKIKRADLASAMADYMRIATDTLNGLMPSARFAQEKRIQTMTSRLIYSAEFKTGNPIMVSLLISISLSGGQMPSVYILTISRSSSSIVMPAFMLKQIAGRINNSPEFRVSTDASGLFKLFYGKSEYTSNLYVKIMGAARLNSDILSFEVADEDEVAAATRIELTA